MEEALRQAAAESPGRLTEVAHGVVAAILSELAGPESPAATATAENLASIRGALDRLPEAIGRFAADDPRVMSVREGLAFLYRRAGEDRKADELYRDLGLCEHLRPAERSLRAAGARLFSLTRPWSDNCHLWAYFDAVLDCERLIETLGLDPCVRIHDHRGTHDGSERGLVCSVHHDALMGAHPTDAPPERRKIP
jgi:hypothetical protein